MPVDLQKLMHALLVARHASFSLAAAELGLTQSALSRSIAALEERWNVQLFARSRSGVVATPAGEELLRLAARLVDEAATLDHNMRQRGKAAAESFAFGLGPFVGHLMMADLTKHVARAFPGLAISASIRNPDELTQEIMLGRIEFGIFSAVGCTTEHGLASEPICEVPYSLIASPAHPLLRRRTVRRADLTGYPLLLVGRGSLPAFATGPKIECDDSRVSIDIVQKSDAIWYCSPWMIRDELRKQVLIDLGSRLAEACDTTASLSLFYAKGRARSLAAAATIRRFKRNVALLTRDPTARFAGD
jgi:DNA-binding transcriptional LysR family regulator